MTRPANDPPSRPDRPAEAPGKQPGGDAASGTYGPFAAPLNMFDLVRGFSGALDLVDAALAGHHQRVACLADRLGEGLGLDRPARNRVTLAAMLHDVGIIALRDPADGPGKAGRRSSPTKPVCGPPFPDDQFQPGHFSAAHSPGWGFEQDPERHCQAGWLILAACPFLRREARVIRYHHTGWRAVAALPEEEREAATLGNIIHLADTMDLWIRAETAAPSARPRTREDLAEALGTRAGTDFSPRAVDIALDLCFRPDFFENLTETARRFAPPPDPELMLARDDVTVFSLLFAHLIDARSPFTATHSSGVAHLARHLHELADLPTEDRWTMFVAGLLHDIGKVGVPLELLEKPGPLTAYEFNLVSRHARLSHEILSAIPGFEKVAPWAAWHHERLNGGGYPAGLTEKEIPFEARLTAVADVLAAVTENRPYRPGLTDREALVVLNKMAAARALDGGIVDLANRHIDDLSLVRRRSQDLARHFFQTMDRDIQKATSG